MTIGYCGTVAGTVIKLRSNDWTCRTILGWVKYVWAKICGTADAINWKVFWTNACDWYFYI